MISTGYGMSTEAGQTVECLTLTAKREQYKGQCSSLVGHPDTLQQGLEFTVEDTGPGHTFLKLVGGDSACVVVIFFPP